MKGVGPCERVCQRVNVNSLPAQLPAELMSLSSQSPGTMNSWDVLSVSHSFGMDSDKNGQNGLVTICDKCFVGYYFFKSAFKLHTGFLFNKMMDVIFFEKNTGILNLRPEGKKAQTLEALGAYDLI